MKKDYTKIENEIDKRYKNLLSNVSSPDALLRSETVKERRKENKNDQSRSFGPAAYWLAAALTLVLTVGVTLFGIKMLNTLGNSAGTDTSTAAETTGAEDTVRRMIIKAKTYVFGEEMNNIDLNGSEREFDLVVSFENVSDLKSASLKISWEKPGLTLKNAEYMVNGLTSTPDKPWSEVKNSYVFNWLAIDAKDVIKSRTEFVKLTFRGSDDIYPGTVRIKIEPDQSNIFDSDSNDVPYTLESETVYFDFLHYTLSDTADHSTKEPDPDPDTYYPEYLIVSDDNEEIQVKAYEESADGATDVSVLQYDGSKIKPEFSAITVIEGVTVEKIGIKADGVPGDYYENYINDYLETKNTGVYRFVVSYEITNNGVSERWEYPFDVEVWIKSDTTDPDPETTAPETTAPETTAPETTAEETTAPETTAPNTTVPETEAETVSFVTEPDNHREKESKQTVHFTDESVEVPSDMSGHKSGIHCGETSNVAFRVLDCGYEQYEKLREISGQALPDATADMLEKISAGELKIWLCDLDGNKIDYVYANKNGIVAFDLYPGEYKLTYEDDGTYKTAYSNIVKVYDESTEKENKTYYRVFNDYETVGSQAYICIYNYQRYRPVTVTVTDDKTGAPVADTAVVYFADYIYSDAEYLRTDENGVLTLNSIFDFMLYKKPGNITSRHREISLYFKNEEYDRIKIKEENILQNTFDIKLHRTEYTEYTVKVINKQTGEPMKNAYLEGNSTLHGDFIIRESGEDGIMKGYLPSEDLTNLYGGKAFPEVHVKYGAVNPAALYLPLYNGVYDFTLYYIETNGVGRFEIAE